MERSQSRIADLGRSLPNFDGDERSGNSIDPALDAVILPGQTTRCATGIKAPRREHTPAEDFVPSDSLRDQLLAIRRRLWILNATLEARLAKIEQTSRKTSPFSGGDGRAPCRDACDAFSSERPALESHAAAGGWWARWKLARLRSRASRAERRAAAALYDASVSFSEALEAVLRAAAARVKADEASFRSLPQSFSEVRP
jgi:hypothetical protein